MLCSLQLLPELVAMAVAMMSLRRRASSRTCLARARSILAVTATLEEKVATSCAYSFSLAKSSTYSSKLAGGDDLLLLVIFSLRRTATSLRPRQSNINSRQLSSFHTKDLGRREKNPHLPTRPVSFILSLTTRRNKDLAAGLSLAGWSSFT